MKAISIVVFITISMGASKVDAEALILDANNNVIGLYGGLSEVDFLRENGYSRQGYRFAFDRDTGRLMWPQGFSAGQIYVYYATSDCTGPAYVSVQSGFGPSKRVPGTVVPAAYDLSETPSGFDAPVFYIPQNRPSEVVVQRQSWWAYVGANLSCQSSAPSPAAPAYEVQPNNPGVTGVPNGRFAAPLRITSSFLFRDGFENVAS